MKIITLTLSPAVDIEYHSRSVAALTRASSHSVFAGGKGVNVSRAIKKLMGDSEFSCGDVELITVYPYGGHTGEMFSSILESEGISAEYAVRTENPTRVNVSLIPESGDELEINSPGAPIGEKLSEIERTVLELTEAGDVVCVCGSVPSDVAKSYPAELCAKVKLRGGIAILDCDGEAMAIAASKDRGEAADLIKPNQSELESLIGEKIERSEISAISERVRSLPFTSVIVTLAGDGAVYVSEGKSFFTPSEKRKVARLKGAGDTFLGAYVYARFGLNKTEEEAMGIASGIAGRYVAGE